MQPTYYTNNWQLSLNHFQEYNIQNNNSTRVMISRHCTHKNHVSFLSCKQSIFYDILKWNTGNGKVTTSNVITIFICSGLITYMFKKRLLSVITLPFWKIPAIEAGQHISINENLIASSIFFLSIQHWVLYFFNMLMYFNEKDEMNMFTIAT